MIRFLTAGESHGKSLVTIIEGFPSNIPISKKYIDEQLRRRQAGYGRSHRMKIESDSVQILSGIRFGKTLGSPISFLIENKDWINWQEIMDIEKSSKAQKKITIPRPGHADLVGTLKYNFNDIRNSIERSSARETAARVSAGAVAKNFLKEFGIMVGSYVESIGGIYSTNNFLDLLVDNNVDQKSFNKIFAEADKSDVGVLDKKQEKKIIDKINLAKRKGDTLGGTFIVIALGVPVGLGSFMHYDRKLDADIAFHIMSINAVKGVEIGDGFDNAEKFGSQVHDEIILLDKYYFSRKTNNAGGIEGGISNGLPIIVRGAMKPISTLSKPLKSTDLHGMKSVSSRYERSDFTAVPSCAVIAEHMLAWVLAKHFLLKFGGDSLEETKDNFSSYTKKSFGRIKKGFIK